MKDMLAELYGKKFLTEDKVDKKKGVVNGAVPVGKPITSETPKETKDTGPEAVKGIKKPEECHSTEESQRKTETVGTKFESKSSFDKLYSTIITEDDALDQVITDEQPDTESPELEDNLTGEEGEEDEALSRLKALRDELDAIIMDLEGTQEGEEVEEEMPSEEEGEFEIPKESFEPHGEPKPLTAKGTELLSGQNVPGKLGKKKSGSTGKIPTTKTSTGKPETLGKKQIPDPGKVSDGPMGSKGAEFIQ